eukprot:698127-Prymnesium_polylepis.3
MRGGRLVLPRAQVDLLVGTVEEHLLSEVVAERHDEATLRLAQVNLWVEWRALIHDHVGARDLDLAGEGVELDLDAANTLRRVRKLLALSLLPPSGREEPHAIIGGRRDHLGPVAGGAVWCKSVVEGAARDEGSRTAGLRRAAAKNNTRQS